MKRFLFLLTMVFLLAHCEEGRQSSSTTEYQKKVFPSDFKALCNATGIEKATAYNKAKGVVSPILIFSRGAVGETYYERTSSMVPKAWKVDWKEVTKTQLVACTTVTDAKQVKTCKLKNRKSDKQLIVNGFDATYKIILYEAKSGKKITSNTMNSKFTRCPMFHMFSRGETEDDSYASIKQPLTDFLQKYVVKR